MNPVLAAASIRVRIGAKTLLDDVSLSLGSGEIVALVGPNGAGKSTLLRVLSGDLTPHAGTVHLNGRRSHPMDRARSPVVVRCSRRA